MRLFLLTAATDTGSPVSQVFDSIPLPGMLEIGLGLLALVLLCLLVASLVRVRTNPWLEQQKADDDEHRPSPWNEAGRRMHPKKGGPDGEDQGPEGP